MAITSPDRSRGSVSKANLSQSIFEHVNTADTPFSRVFEVFSTQLERRFPVSFGRDAIKGTGVRLERIRAQHLVAGFDFSQDLVIRCATTKESRGRF